MIIKNNRTGVVSIGYNVEGGVGSLQLMPGFNPTVNAKLWHTITRDNAAVKGMLEEGIIEVSHLEPGEQDDGKDHPHDQKSVEHKKQVYELIVEKKSVKDAIEDVKMLLIPEQLEQLIQHDKRKPVIEAAKHQLEQLRAPTEHRKNDHK